MAFGARGQIAETMEMSALERVQAMPRFQPRLCLAFSHPLFLR